REGSERSPITRSLRAQAGCFDATPRSKRSAYGAAVGTWVRRCRWAARGARWRAVGGVEQVAGKGEKTLTEIEETQAALRESIETARNLADQSDRLIRKHRKE